MGIHKLIPRLKSKQLLRPFTNWPEGSRVAIDVPIFAYKFIYSERTYESLEKRFIIFAEDLRQKKCEPIFVFDGAKLALKDQERLKRQKTRDRCNELSAQKASAHIENLLDLDIEIVDDFFNGILFPTFKEYATLKGKLDSLGYTTKQAKYEAEALCAYLVKTDVAWCAITEDTDAIAFGSKRTILKYFEEPQEANLDFILEGLELNQQQFIELCCLLGCDFCNNIYMIGPAGAYDLMKKYGSIDAIFEAKHFLWKQKTLASANELIKVKTGVVYCFETSCYESIIDLEQQGHYQPQI
jgi:flap endonuclease-1